MIRSVPLARTEIDPACMLADMRELCVNVLQTSSHHTRCLRDARALCPLANGSNVPIVCGIDLVFPRLPALFHCQRVVSTHPLDILIRAIDTSFSCQHQRHRIAGLACLRAQGVRRTRPQGVRRTRPRPTRPQGVRTRPDGIRRARLHSTRAARTQTQTQFLATVESELGGEISQQLAEKLVLAPESWGV